MLLDGSDFRVLSGGERQSFENEIELKHEEYGVNVHGCQAAHAVHTQVFVDGMKNTKKKPQSHKKTPIMVKINKYINK